MSRARGHRRGLAVRGRLYYYDYYVLQAWIKACWRRWRLCSNRRNNILFEIFHSGIYRYK